MDSKIFAKVIMTRNVRSIEPTTSIIEAIDILLENRISGLPVVDKERKLVGIVSEIDLLNILFRSDVKVEDQVQEYMTKKVNFFREEDSVYDICEFFLKNKKRRVPIVDSEGRLAGIVSRRDILRVVLTTVLSMENKN